MSSNQNHGQWVESRVRLRWGRSDAGKQIPTGPFVSIPIPKVVGEGQYLEERSFRQRRAYPFIPSSLDLSLHLSPSQEQTHSKKEQLQAGYAWQMLQG